MRTIVTLPSRLIGIVSARLQSIPQRACDVILHNTDTGADFPQLQAGDGLLIMQPADSGISRQAAATAELALVHYGEAAVIESGLAAQHGFMVAAGGKAADLHILSPILNALSPCPYGWWHVGEAGSAAFLLEILGQLGKAMQNPIDLSNPLPQLAQLAAMQQQSGILAAKYLMQTEGERFVAVMPDRQRALAAFTNGAESPARQIARLIRLFSTPLPSAL